MLLKLKRLIAKELRKIADKLDAGTCELSEQEAIEIVSMLTHRVMSKTKACEYLNLSRSRFDDLIRDGLIPSGRKRVGFKELVWWEDELNECIKELNK
jgi:predicted DNA-binding transcriptional regulator AlpA